MKCLARLTRRAAVVLSLAAAQANASSALMDEMFAYSNGDLTNVSSGATFPWTTISGTTGPIQVQSGRAIVVGSSSASEDSARQIDGNTYTTGTDLYFSFELTMTAIPSSMTGSEYFFALDNSSTGFRARIFPKKITTTTYEIGVANAAGSLGTAGAATFTATDLSLNTANRIVVKYHIDNATLGNTTATLWINPSSESDASVTATDAPGSSSVISRVLLRQPGDGTIGTMNIDNIVVGTTFADVIPEPATWALVGVSLLGLLAVRFRHS
jgi:hypothetical protein